MSFFVRRLFRVIYIWYSEWLLLPKRIIHHLFHQHKLVILWVIVCTSSYSQSHAVIVIIQVTFYHVFTMINPNLVIRFETMFVEVNLHKSFLQNSCTITLTIWTSYSPIILITFLLASFRYKLFNSQYKRLFQSTSSSITPIIHPSMIWWKVIHVLFIKQLTKSQRFFKRSCYKRTFKSLC